MKITLSRRAAAFRTSVGVFYALFESSYDASEVHPIPRSTCVAFGTITQVIGWIFASLADYEIGFRRGPDGLTSPEQVLVLWKEALSRPDRLFTQPVWLDATSGAEATIPTTSNVWYDGNMLPHAVSQLLEHGYETVAGRVRSGERVVLDLHRDASVLAGIYGYDARWPHIAPWRIVQPQTPGEGDPSLAPDMRHGHATVPALSLNLLNASATSSVHCVAMKIKGHKTLFGTQDQLFQLFASEVALACELQESGAGHKAIAAFREVLAQPFGRLESGVGITVATGTLFGEPSRHALATLTRVCGHSAISLSGDQLLFPLESLRKHDMVTVLASLPGIALDLVCKTRMRRLARSKAPALAKAA